MIIFPNQSTQIVYNWLMQTTASATYWRQAAVVKDRSALADSLALWAVEQASETPFSLSRDLALASLQHVDWAALADVLVNVTEPPT